MQGYDNNTPTNTTQANPISRDSNLVTDLTNSLSLQETNLPAKGPKFSLSPGVNKHTVRDINIAFCRLANQIRWKEYRLKSKSKSNACRIHYLPSI